MGGGDGDFLFNACDVSVGKMRKVLELDRGGGCTLPAWTVGVENGGVDRIPV